MVRRTACDSTLDSAKGRAGQCSFSQASVCARQQFFVGLKICEGTHDAVKFAHGSRLPTYLSPPAHHHQSLETPTRDGAHSPL